jgi:hypothetical protein
MSDVPDGIQDTGSLEAWESIVGQLHAHEFSRQEVFYIVTGIGQADAEMPEGDDLKTPTLCDAENGRLVLNPQSDYEIRVYHYYPNSAPTQSMHLVVESTSPLIRFSTPTKVPIDSPYDLKRFRFRTGGAVSEEFPVISVCSQHAGATATVAFGVDLLAIIRGQWQRFAWYGLSIGILIGLSPAVAAVANSALSDTQKVLITVLSLVAGIVAGEVAAFGLKKL